MGRGRYDEYTLCIHTWIRMHDDSSIFYPNAIKYTFEIQ